MVVGIVEQGQTGGRGGEEEDLEGEDAGGDSGVLHSRSLLMFEFAQ